MLAISTRDHVEVDSALQDIRQEHPRAAAILEELFAPHRAAARGEQLTTGQAALILGVTPQSVRNWVDAGWLPSQRRSPFGRRMIDPSALVELGRFRTNRDLLAASGGVITEEQAAETLRAHRAKRSTAEVGGGSR